MAHLARAEVVVDPNRWVATVPAVELLTVDAALRAIDVVVSDAGKVVNETGWPVHAALKQAFNNMQTVAAGLETYAAKGVVRLKPDFTRKLRARIVELGLTLYRETDVLLDAWKNKADAEIARGRAMKNTLRDVVFFDIPISVLLVVGGLLWWNTRKDTRGSDVLASFRL
jgi:hypothetical protein